MFTGHLSSEMYQKMRYERVDTLLVIDRKGKLHGIITGKMIQKEKESL